MKKWSLFKLGNVETKLDQHCFSISRKRFSSKIWFDCWLIRFQAQGGNPGQRALFDTFFRFSSEEPLLPVARAVLVDMEPKVIQSNSHFVVCEIQRSRLGCLIRKSNETWRYDRRRTCSRQSGAANNWAFGFFGHGPLVHDEALEVWFVVSLSLLHCFCLIYSASAVK